MHLTFSLQHSDSQPGEGDGGLAIMIHELRLA
jgi:hypothetical protein